MLERLLREIRSGGTLETATLAARLGTTPRMVEGMLEYLERSGQLQAVGAGPAEPCGPCALAETCTAGCASGAKLWRWRPRSV